jgi:tetratricopeptide (TPR) repeat protein
MMRKKHLLKSMCTLVAMLLLSTRIFAQLTAAEEKAVNKSIELYKAGSYDKAIDKLQPVQGEHPLSEQLWQYRIAYESARYTDYLNTVIQKAIKKAEKSGNEPHIDDPKLNEYYSSLIVACYQATMFADHQDDASSILRRYLVDPKVDTAISEKAQELYNKGDEEYSQEHWNASIKKYKEALEVDSNYYMAAFSIGLAYRKNEDYTNAVPYFQKAARIAPGRALPFQFIADCYMELKQWDNAKNACIDGILVYPDVAFFTQLSKITEKLGKTFDRHWGIRVTFPNDVTLTQTPAKTEPWSNYSEAKDRVADYCNDHGVITKKNSVTEHKYLEAFSWEQMLKKSSAEDEKTFENFTFAKEMMKAGFLDCYVFISMYHYKTHEQYQDFSKKNADRIREYVNTYLMKE